MPRKRRKRNRIARWRDAPRVRLVLASVLLLVAAFVLMPRPVARVVPVEGTRGWDRDEAPPRREIVWTDARTILADDARVAGDSDRIAPTLTDSGATLYFARRDGAGRADILRSRLVDGAWSEAEAVGVLNTPFDEIGPVVGADGQELLFYSDRPGGEGGFDLWVSRKTRQGWSKPRNLGPRINTPGHEYDPALSPDGLTIYFASNRSESMSERAARRNGDEASWTATLRADPGRTSFDLYQASREGTRGPWEPAAALEELNLPQFNEGAPAVSPEGGFLYFASDRPVRKGEDVNLDLYRSRRVDGGFGAVENLGSSINTAAHETEPGLSPEGFQLVFSSDRDGRDALYVSRAQEVLEETEWRRTQLPAVPPLPWSWLLYSALPLSLLLAVYWYRNRLMERVWPARFFFGSVLLNTLLLLVLVFWKLPGVLQDLINPDEPAEITTQLVDNNQHQSHADGREAYEKVHDLKAIEQADVQPVSRTETSPVSVPRRNQNPLPTVPPEVARTLPARRVIHVPPVVVGRPMPLQRLTRRAPSEQSEIRELADATDDVTLLRVEKPRQRSIETQVEVERAEQTLPKPTVANVVASLPPVQAAQLPSTEIPPDARAQVVESPAPTRPRVDLTRNSRRPSKAIPTQPLEDLPEVARQETPSAREPVAEAETIARSEPEQPAPQAPVAAEPTTAEPIRMSVSRQLARAELSARGSSFPSRSPLPSRASRGPDARELADALQENDLELAGVEAESPQPLQETQVALSRTETAPADFNSPTRAEMSGPASLQKHRIVIGALSDQRNNAAPAFGTRVSRLSRKRARATKVALAEDNVGMKALFTLRQGDTRKTYIELFGGTEESEKAVSDGLMWLAKHQNYDGSWSLDGVRQSEQKKTRPYPNSGNINSDTAATGLALLPFLAAGNTHLKGEYRKNVVAAVHWLITHQKPDGDLFVPGNQHHWMYSHGIASIALCEAYGMTQDPELRQPSRSALDFIIKAQNAKSGGWRYKPGERGDTSVVGWQVMALKSGEMAGLAVPRETLERTAKWLKSVEDRNNPGRFGYERQGATPAMTAEGLLCLQFMQTDRNDPRMLGGAEFLQQNLPRKDQRLTSYSWYYGTQVMYHMQGRFWKAWNEHLRQLLIETQITEGALAGTWQPRDRWETSGGRLYTTSLKLLILEVYYRHLPLYDQLISEDDEQ